MEDPLSVTSKRRNITVKIKRSKNKCKLPALDNQIRKKEIKFRCRFCFDLFPTKEERSEHCKIEQASLTNAVFQDDICVSQLWSTSENSCLQHDFSMMALGVHCPRNFFFFILSPMTTQSPNDRLPATVPDAMSVSASISSSSSQIQVPDENHHEKCHNNHHKYVTPQKLL